MPRARRKLMVEYLNMVSIIVVIFPLVNICSFWFKATDDTPRPWSSYVGLNETPQTLAKAQTPDIYYTILDGYGSEDILVLWESP